jgi:type I restriction enzyme S subunit
MRDGWTETTLDDLVLSGVVSLGRGNVISKKDMEADPGPYPVYSSAQNNDGRIGSYNKFMFDEELITWSVDGGGYVFYRPHHKFSVTNIGGYLRILDDTKFLYPFLAAVLQKLHSQHVFDWQNKAHPSVIRKLYNNVPLASLPEQKRIVDLAASVDAYIDALQQKADTARTARNSVLHELLTAGGDDWSETTLGELANFRRDRLDPLSLDSAHLLCHWSIPALDEFGGPLWEPAGKIGSHKFRVRENAVVFSLLNPRIPRFALVLGGDDVVCSTEFAVMQPTDLIHETFLLLLASSNIFQKVVGSLASGTTKSRERVKPSDLEGVSISLPPIEEQIRIVEIVSSMDEVIQTTEKAMAEAKNLRSGLLSELLSGEHEIPASYDSMLGAA